MGGLKTASVGILAAVLSWAALAQERANNSLLFKERDGAFTVERPSNPDWCQPHITLTVRGRDSEVFTGDVSMRLKLGGGIQAFLPRVCPKVQRATVNGFVDDVLVYRAITVQPNAADKWALLELPVIALARPPEPPAPTAEEALPDREPRAASVAECDREAAHPDDPTKPPGVSGVIDEEMHAGRALEACEEAVIFDPVNPRIMYQLARAYLLFDRPVEGVELMTEAAEEGHGAAIAVLGDIALYGLLGDDPDPDLARALYQRAAAAGFAPAAALAAAIQENPDLDAANSVSGSVRFHQAKRIQVLLQGRALDGPLEERGRNYLYGTYVIGGIMSHCPVTGLTLEDITDHLTRMPAPFQAAIVAAAVDGDLTQQGMDDGYALAFDRGCTSREVEAVHATMRLTAP